MSPPTTETPIDRVFERFDVAAPGCAVGVNRLDSGKHFRAYGLADLEHGVPINAHTVFEAGSVSKQFAAAAVLLLVEDAQLSLQDDIRRYLPEIPDYGEAITVSMLLNHTSGLRDWGDVQDAAGWPRGDRIFTLESVLRIASRQQALNYSPGTQWSYTNTGFNLAAILVERVSGQSLAAFSRDRIFVPLGMTRTRWRDDFRTVVPGRAAGYREAGSGYELDMPFENAYGNGGLLTTVGDLLTWAEALHRDRLGEFVTDRLQRRTDLADGDSANYGFGLYVQQYRGFREVSHPGATAGYTAWLGMYPNRDLFIALLCNSGDVNPMTLGRAVADLFLPPGQSRVRGRPEAGLTSYAGWYVDDRSGTPLHLVAENEELRAANGPYVEASASGDYRLGSRELRFKGDGSIELTTAGVSVDLRPTVAFRPDDDLANALAGRYFSPEAGAHYVIFADDGRIRLRITERPDVEFILEPAYEGAFTFGYSLLRYVRSPDGQIDTLRISSSRLWDLRMRRMRASSGF